MHTCITYNLPLGLYRKLFKFLVEVNIQSKKWTSHVKIIVSNVIQDFEFSLSLDSPGG